MPAPTIATKPWGCNCVSVLALSFGNTSAITSVIPTCLAIAVAVVLLSPVSIITFKPSRCISAIEHVKMNFTSNFGHTRCKVSFVASRSVTVACPFVMVPVLSKTIVFSL
jgi:hypothetical protein